MKKNLLTYLIIALLALSFTSCGDLTNGIPGLGGGDLPGGGGGSSKDYSVTIKYTDNKDGSTWVDLYDFGESVTLSVKAEAKNGDPSYQWYKADNSSDKGKAISGATSASYTITSLSELDAYYYCVATNTANKDYSKKTNSIHIVFTMDREWTSTDEKLYAKYTYIVNYVNISSTVTIEPGTKIKFTRDDIYGVKILGNGVLKAEGTAEKPIIFTSNKAEPNAGDWQTILSEGATGSSFKYCVFEYGQDVLQLDATTTVTNCTFKDNKSETGALIIKAAAKESTATDNVFYNNIVPVRSVAFFTVDASNKFSKIILDANNATIDVLENSKPYISLGSDSIENEATFEEDEIPYLLDEYLAIYDKVTIKPGVTFEFNTANGRIVVHENGYIFAEGTEEKPITFTSPKAEKNPGDWDYISINENANGSIFDWCVFEYGQDVLELNATTIVTNCTFKDNKSETGALIIKAAAKESTATDNVFYNNIVPVRSVAFFTVDASNKFSKIILDANNVTIDVLENSKPYISLGSDSIENEATFEEDEIPYLLDEWLAIYDKVTIKPGVTFEFNTANGKIDVHENGYIFAEGTEEKPITFTSPKAQKKAGDWSNILIFENASGSIFDWCVFEYGQEALELNAETTVTNCTFRYNKSTDGALYVKEYSYGSTIDYNTFYGNDCPVFLHANISIGDNNVFHFDVEGADPIVNTKQYIFINSGSIYDQEVTYGISEVPYIMLDWHNFGDGSSLIVKDGVILKFKNTDSYLKLVEGSNYYFADGCIFTSFKDDANGGDSDGVSVTPKAGDWRGIDLDNGNWLTGDNILYAEVHE